MPRDPMEQLIRALLDRERLANSLSVDERARVDELFREIEEVIRRSNPSGPSAARYRRLRTERLLKAVRKRFREFSPELERSLKDALAQIGRKQAEQAQLGLIATIGSTEVTAATVKVGITQQRLRAILNTDPFRGRLLSEHTSGWSDLQYRRVRDQVRLGMTNEESIDDIVRRVRGRATGWRSTATGKRRKTGGPRAVRVFTGGVLEGSRQEVESLVRTSVTYVSNVGAMETYAANNDVVSGLEFVATLDDRTTVVCLDYDGTVWSLEDPKIQQPPLHFQCRSILVPVVDWQSLGLDPPPSGTRIARDMSTVSDEDLARKVSARRRTGDFGKVTKVSSNTRATEWLREQRPAVQNKVLGRGVAERFRAGDLSVSDLIRGDNTVRPLRELLN